MTLAFQAFGRELPDLGLLLPVIALMVLFLLFNRNGGLEGGGGKGAETTGHGREYQCTRCGFEFHPEQRVKHKNGQVSTKFDDRCPNCGWDLDWGNYDDPNNPRR